MNNEMVTKKRKLDNEMDLEFCTDMFSAFNSLYRSKSFCDITLIAGENNQKFSCHRIILAASNEHFRTKVVEAKNATSITLQGIHGEFLNILIDYCYTGALKLNMENLCGIWKTAFQLKFLRVEKKCKVFLLEKLNVSNALSIWTSAKSLNEYPDIEQSAFDFIREHFSEVIEQDGYLQLDVENVVELLKNDELNVWSEEEVFNAMTKWIEYDAIGRKCLVKKLLSAIRFAYLKPNFLYNAIGILCDKLRCLDLTIGDIYKCQLIPYLPRPSSLSCRYLAIGFRTESLDYQQFMEISHPITKSWSLFKAFTCKRYGFCSTIFKNELLIFGGRESNVQPVLQSMQRFNFTTKTLSDGDPMIEARADFAATVLDNNIYVAGGEGSSSVERYTTTSGTWSRIAPMFEIRASFTLVSVNGKLYAIGGKKDKNTVLNSVEKYNLFKNKWKQTAPMSHNRCAHGAFTHKGLLYVVGGAPGALPVEYYDPIVDKWMTIEQATIPRYRFGLVVDGEYIIIAGGVDSNKQMQSDVVKINVNTFVLEQMPAMKFPKMFLNLIKLPVYNFYE